MIMIRKRVSGGGAVYKQREKLVVVWGMLGSELHLALVPMKSARFYGNKERQNPLNPARYSDHSVLYERTNEEKRGSATSNPTCTLDSGSLMALYTLNVDKNSTELGLFCSQILSVALKHISICACCIYECPAAALLVIRM
jgi:hypothetical protein